MQSEFLQCKPCGKKFTGKECMKQHMESGKHLKKVHCMQKQLQQAPPELVATYDMEVSSSDTLDGNESEGEQEVSDDSRSVSPDTPSISLECQVCLKSCSSVQKYMLHIKSKEHINAVQMSLVCTGVPPSPLPVASTQRSSVSQALPPNQYRCDVCDISCTGQAPFDQHLASAKHIKKKSQKAGVVSDSAISTAGMPDVISAISNTTDGKINIIICETCDVPCSGKISYEMHLRGEKHKKKELLKNASTLSNEMSAFGLSGEVNLSRPIGENSNSMICEICNVSCCGLIPYETHLRGEKHRKKMVEHNRGKNIFRPIEVNNPVGKYEEKKTMIASSPDFIGQSDSSNEDSMDEEYIDCSDGTDSSSSLIRRIGVVAPSIRDILCKDPADLCGKYDIANFGVDEPIDFVKMLKDRNQNDEMIS